jgi:hypothetical protein
MVSELFQKGFRSISEVSAVFLLSESIQKVFRKCEWSRVFIKMVVQIAALKVRIQFWHEQNNWGYQYFMMKIGRNWIILFTPYRSPW